MGVITTGLLVLVRLLYLCAIQFVMAFKKTFACLKEIAVLLYFSQLPVEKWLDSDAISKLIIENSPSPKKQAHKVLTSFVSDLNKIKCNKHTLRQHGGYVRYSQYGGYVRCSKYGEFVRCSKYGLTWLIIAVML
ncbi:uncharacterized protein EV154DRAFT_528262 [Mucor mucedo]|uniref:uncharacterized protein n=1 Tax=Mucor mucedo TaxID=29922 RepID=UPI0022202CEF|nr:uncharacterized protein EV154DRAFT_528262 [Mucor mucedo]KAI7873349.1 hypothetical protein EV154DRAFT_528262 [Mucor mucedo]